MQLSKRQGDGASLRVHLQRRAESTGRVDPRLVQVEIPAPMRELWEAYRQLDATRRNSGMGLHRITLADVAAWCRLMCVRLTPWEVDTLIGIDAAALAVASEQGASA